jgi:predicted ATP-dependent endonuclease of OLD family
MEENIFITEIKINQLRHLHDITIPVVKDGGRMKHLVLTGKNGSGKTSLLEAVANYLGKVIDSKSGFHHKGNNLLSVSESKKNVKEDDIRFYYKELLKEKGGIDLFFNSLMNTILSDFINGSFIIASFEAKRIFDLKRPESIERLQPNFTSGITVNNSNDFLKYLVFLRSRLTDASYRNDEVEVKKLENWFMFFEATLRKIFNDEELKLEYDSSNLNFNIIQTNKSLFDFNTLSDGYAAILRILTELMMRMENKKADAYDINGIVLIDEIETHLHIELQKSILPFLTAFFPKVQFIVTTHSPFILNSIENAVVYDLENHLLFEDASELSYSSLIKNYFLVDSEYSLLMEKKINDFEALINKPDRTESDDEKLADLLVDLKTLSPLLSPEMYVRFQQAQKKIMKKSTAGN